MSDNPNPPVVPDRCWNCKLETNHGLPFCTRCGYDLRHSRKKNSKSTCAFCGIYTKMSREHAFPKWLREKFPTRFNRTEHILRRPERYEFWTHVPKHLGIGSGHGQGDPYSKVVKHVCERCNNGWMAQLQREAKPVILRLAQGEWPDLDERERMTLSRWCAMTTISFEYHGGIVTVPQWQREALMKGDMPAGWRVSLARMADNTCAGSSFHRALTIPIGMGPPGEFTRAQSTYFCIEEVLFYTFSTLGDRVLNAVERCFDVIFNEMSDQIADKYGLRRIWPDDRFTEISNVSRIDSSSIKSLQERFGEP